LLHINNCTLSLTIQEASLNIGSQFTCNGRWISLWGAPSVPKMVFMDLKYGSIIHCEWWPMSKVYNSGSQAACGSFV